MPELPDVEVFKEYLNSTGLHQKIDNLKVTSEYILEGITARTLKRHVENEEFESARRHGKYMFVELSSDEWLVLHFGMTGFLKYTKDGDNLPEHSRLVFKFKNGYHLAYSLQRKLGMVGLVDDMSEFIAEQKLGVDPLTDEWTKSEFDEIIDSSRGSIKAALTNQSAIAGIGNIYSDEILFRAGIHPRTKAGRLTADDRRKLFKSIDEVLNTAIDCRVDKENFPRTYLIRHREKNANCPKCDGKIEKIKVSGRSTYFCNKHQKQR